ncbi:single-stranded DNA-binding protein [uncultured Pseudomonas sp.]|uniref:single-stranded DNA-binding protein n=1 Tax=uncultured Pseudomonas sp. TaxID=114707 RepID=UPI0025FDC2F7|nr:single-stranded DNA-binding protein [uncultured Pseudomonas sp.]
MALLLGAARIGNEPSIRYTTGNNPQAVLELDLPFNYGRKDQQTGKRPTQWVQATLWGARAEALAPYLTKGQWVNVALSDAHIEEYQRNGGGQGAKLVARITEIELIGDAPQGQQQRQQPQQQSRPQSQQRPQQQPQGDDQFDDDIPF